MAIYPNGYFTWTDRIDLVNIDFAADINSVAHDLIAAETVLGANPQIEKSPVVGSNVTYSNLDARVSDVNAGNQRPVCSLSSSLINVQVGASVYGTYNKLIDTSGMFNGQDITVKASGWYSVYAATQANPNGYLGVGWSMIMLYVNNLYVGNDNWRWDFPNRQLWPIGLLGNAGHLHLTWEGACHAGDRIRVIYVNGTFDNPAPFISNVLKASFQRKLTNFVTG